MARDALLARDIGADVLLGLAVAVVISASVGVLVMRDPYQKLHFVTPAALIAPVLVTLAVLARMGLSENAGETCVALLFMVVAGPFLSPGPGRRGGGAGERPMTAAVSTPYTVPVVMMDILQVTILILVAAGATAVVLIRERVRQVLALSVYGVLLSVLFLAFQAPDVTLSELTVGAIALPVVLLLTLAKIRKREE
jgi:energy-converting hydrogenase B subunit D